MGDLESAEQWWARVEAALAPDRTLAAIQPDSSTEWDAFPLAVDPAARTRPLQQLADSDPPRFGEDPATCQCVKSTSDGGGVSSNTIWVNENWALKRMERSGFPLTLILEPKAHLDIADLPTDLAAEFGLLTVRISAAVESLPSVGRAHVYRIGDGGAHAHVWFFARPARQPQIIGSVALLWEELLPTVPDDVRDANARHVATQLVTTHGGEAVGVAAQS